VNGTNIPYDPERQVYETGLNAPGPDFVLPGATNVLSVKAGGAAQLTGTTNRGVHCAVVFDPGNLTKDATFSLNIARPK
jgi:hypothetical protein